MSLKNFATYNLAVQFHQTVVRLELPSYLRDQLLRSSSSIVLNIAEATGKLTFADRRKFFSIALGSLRESSAALDLIGKRSDTLSNLEDQLGACLWRLCHPR